MGRKWIDEKVLQKYFVDNFDDYSIVLNGVTRKIISCRFNEPFDRFPDLYVVLDDGFEYPVEVEWLSSHYDHDQRNKEKTKTQPYTHKMFEENGGFLVVLEKDSEIYSFQQIIIDKRKFEKWFKKEALSLIHESIQQFEQERLKKRTHTKIWFIYVSEKVEKNWTHSRLKSNSDIKDIKADDIVIFFGPVEVGSKKLKGWPRVSDEKLREVAKAKDYVIHNIEVFGVTKSYYYEKNNVKYVPIWSDEDKINQKYPNRFEFNTKNIAKVNSLTFNEINFYTLTKLKEAIMRSPIEIDYSNFVELLRYFK